MELQKHLTLPDSVQMNNKQNRFFMHLPMIKVYLAEGFTEENKLAKW